ncbi:MAG: DEAD/DEAH box helicase [Clostridia bacterium]|nr:DEAD/DEAH box helicase [Clostridia bacterium]
MPLYSLKKIGQRAQSRQVYLRGVGGYNAGWVQDYAAVANAFYPEFVTADVDEKGALYRVEVGFDHTDEAEYISCSCGQFRADEGACKHIVAVLVYKYYKDMIAALPTAAQLSPRTAAVKTDVAARRLIDEYTTDRTRRIEADVETDRVTLTPILSLQGARPSVSFTLGTTRQYVLKNLPHFAQNMAQKATVEYGKQLTLMHERSRFDKASRPLLDFLLAELSDRQAQPTFVGGADALLLTPAGMDRFFAAVRDGAVVLRTPDGDRTVSFADADLTQTVTVERRGEDGVCFHCEETPFTTGLRTVYILRDDTLYRTSSAYGRAMAQWLHACRQSQNSLFVATNDLAAFCGSVLTTVKPYITLVGDVGALAPYRTRALTVKIYLDAPDDATVTAEVTFAYGEDTVSAYAPSDAPTQPWRDTLGEMRAKALIQPHFSAVQPQTGKLVLHADDDGLFSFLTDGVEALRRVGEVYATDALDRLLSARPIRLSVGLSLSGDLLDMALDVGDIDPIDLDGIISGYREKKAYHRLKDGRFISLDDAALERLAALAQTLGVSKQELRSGRVSLPKYRALYLETLLKDREGIRLSRDETFRALTRRVREAAECDCTVPEDLRATLRGYQVTGFRWLRTMEELGFGGILADDMGLGKTVQIITLLLDAKRRGVSTPSLVVCPTSVVLGWEREMARFAPSLRVLCVTGDAAARASLIAQAADYDVLVTSYDMLKRDIAHYVPLTFAYHILDEAQYIKNSTTQNARAVKAIRAAHRFALTGTPMENRLSELWSIFDFLMPGLLFSYAKFRARFEQPIVRGQDAAALERLQQMVSPFILRRLKRDVLTELPPKTERVLPSVMGHAQRQVYLATCQQLRAQLRSGTLTGQGRMTVLALLTRLRQICCDPRLCCDGYVGESCKLETCMELVREAVDGGHKALLFSQFTSMLELLAARLDAEGVAYYLLQGSTPKEERAQLVEAFNADATPVFLISLKAGGTGLNLTGADVVIHYDPWWNLSVQNQATDRAYRIGQKNPVQVVRLIAQDTVEERIVRLQEDKWELAVSVVDAVGPSIESLSAQELLAILG